MTEGHAALVGRFAVLSREDIAHLWGSVLGDCRRVTFVAVADAPVPDVRFTATGFFNVVVVNDQDLKRPTWVEAAVRAQELIRLAPDAIAADHLVVDGWRAARRHVTPERYDRVLVADRPRGLWERARIRAAGWHSRNVEASHRALAAAPIA